MAMNAEWGIEDKKTIAYVATLFYIFLFLSMTIFFFVLFLLDRIDLFLTYVSIAWLLPACAMLYFTYKDNWIDTNFYSKQIDSDIKIVVPAIERTLKENQIPFRREPWGKRRPLWLKIFKSGVIVLRLTEKGLYIFIRPPVVPYSEGELPVFTVIHIGPVEEGDERLFEILELIDEVG